MNWKEKTYLIGILIGAIAGAAAAKLMIDKAEQNNEPIRIDLKKGAKMGLAILDTVKKIS